MVDCCFEGYAACVGNESPCWFEAYDPAVSGWETDGAALVCADCEVYGFGGEKAG